METSQLQGSLEREELAKGPGADGEREVPGAEVGL